MFPQGDERCVTFWMENDGNAEDKPRRFGMKVMEEDRHVAARNPPLIISCFLVMRLHCWDFTCQKGPEGAKTFGKLVKFGNKPFMKQLC